MIFKSPCGGGRGFKAEPQILSIFFLTFRNTLYVQGKPIKYENLITTKYLNVFSTLNNTCLIQNSDIDQNFQERWIKY